MSVKKPTKQQLDRADKIIAFAERYIRVPEGKFVGQPLKLEPFQKDFIRAVYSNPYHTHTAILSMGRKNAKTATIMILLLAHIAGPEAVQNSQIASGALSREQASVIFNLAVKAIHMSPELSERIRIFPSAKKLLGLSKNVEYRALAAEGKTAHGLSLIFCVLDETGQIKGPTDPFVEAIETSQGAYDHPLKIIISTQAPTDNDMLSRMIDAPDDPQIVKHVYTVPEDLDPYDEKNWYLANPALGKFRSLADVRKQAEKAKAQPSFEPAFFNLILNRRTEAQAPFVSQSIWAANSAPPTPSTKEHRRRVYGGLDLSSVSDLTAAVLVDEADGSVHSYFWLPEDDLRGRSARDKVPYDVWNSQGFLLTTPGKAIQYQHVALYLRKIFDQFDVVKFGFDRYLMSFLREWLQKDSPSTGRPLFTEEEIERFVEFGQGTASMTPALRDLEVKLIEGQLKHGNHPVLLRCAANCRVVGDSGARKFDKKTSRGRIDGMVALAMAVGVMPQKVEKPKRTWDDYLAEA